MLEQLPAYLTWFKFGGWLRSWNPNSNPNPDPNPNSDTEPELKLEPDL
jgi:hypothetical protein